MVRGEARVKTSDERETDSTDLKANAMKFIRNKHKKSPAKETEWRFTGL